MIELSAERFVVFMVMVGILLSPIHELGHIICARLVDYNVIHYELIGKNPHVDAEGWGENLKVRTGVFLIGGFLLTAITFVAYAYFMSGVYVVEVYYFILVNLIGCRFDFIRIVELLK